MIDSTVATLRQAWRETAVASAAAARRPLIQPGAALDKSRDSKYERARQAAEDIAAELEGSTLEAALDEGDRLYENPEARWDSARRSPGRARTCYRRRRG